MIPSLRHHWFSLFIILCVVILAHANIFSNQFVYDDYDFIVNWPLIEDLSNWPSFFVNYSPPPRQPGVYSPLKTLFHALFFNMFYLNPFGYHVMSLIIHAIGIWLVFSLAFILSKSSRIAFWTALLFGLHPVHVEAITYMTASVDMIGILFLFASLYVYILHRQNPHNEWFYPLAFSSAVLAVFAHELALSVPLLISGYDVIYEKKTDMPKRIKAWAPFYLLSAVYIVCKFLVLGSITRGGYLMDSFNLTMLVIVKSLLKYVVICLLPLTLTINHVIAPGIYSFGQDDFDVRAVLSQSWFDPPVVAALILLALIGYWAWRSRHQDKIITLCIGWFFLSLVPVLNLVPSGVYFGERYLYPGLAAFCLLIVYCLYRFLPFSRVIGGVRVSLLIVMILTSLAVFYGVRTYIRNYDWRDDVHFFETVVKHNPQSALMRRDMGITYKSHGYYDKALESFMWSLALQPEKAETYFAMGGLFQETGQYQKATHTLLQAVRVKPDFAEAYFNLAVLYALQQKKNQSRQMISRALELLQEQKEEREAQRFRRVYEDYFGAIPEAR